MSATPMYDTLVKKHDFDPSKLERYDCEKAKAEHGSWYASVLEKVAKADLSKPVKRAKPKPPRVPQQRHNQNA